jgi:hypothetical protein
MKDLIQQINSGPSFLFLGQNYSKLETGRDIFLEQILNKYGNGEKSPMKYDSIFNTQMSQNRDEAVSWMLIRCMNIPVPYPLELISGYAWNGIFTSSFDEIIIRAFRSIWRDVQPITDQNYRPSEPRNRSKLNIWQLFGSLATPDETNYPPLSLQDFWNRQAIAAVLAYRLPELITPIGTLVIEGYECGSDWFSTKELFPIISSLAKGQTHIFSATEEIEQDDRLNFLISEQKLTLHQESLAQYLEYSAGSGQIKLGIQPEEIEFSHQIRINHKTYNIPTELWNLISSTGIILSESIFLPISPLSEEKRYSEFRRFLFESSYCPPWDGYARGFAFKREFEEPLKLEILRRLESAVLRRSIILLHGQTGTGKTIAMGRLAYDIQKEGKFPVIFIPRTTGKIKKDAIDRFCEWAENKGANATLIVWDGMQQPSEYSDLINYLQSRGRNALLMGSCYKIGQEINHIGIAFEALSEINDSELSSFLKFITSIDPDLVEYIQKRISSFKGSFLVFLYRLLPPSRTSIRKGLEKELAFAEIQISGLAQDKRVEVAVNTILGDVLKQAGFNSMQSILAAEPHMLAGQHVTELQELIGLVMVPGQFNLNCPFELLIRALKKDYMDELIEILKSVDIFRWNEDLVGNLFIGARSSLEAELITQQRIGGPSFEVDYAINLISAVQSDRLFEQQELQFAIELIQNVGPNGRKPQYYEQYFIKIAQCLENVRTKGGIVHPRLMLQESMLFRESAKSRYSENERIELLRKSESVSKIAFEALENIPQNRSARSRILVELASTYGQMANQATAIKDKLKYADMSRETCYQALSLDSQNFHPFDVIAWTTRDILEDQRMDTLERLRVEESVIHAFNLADAEGYTGNSLERLTSRKEELFSTLGKTEFSDEAFEALIKQGSTAGIYLRSIRPVRFIFDDSQYTDVQRIDSQKSYEYLLEYKSFIESDSKCMYLLLRLWWAWKTGMYMGVKERCSLPLTLNDWNECRRLVTILLDYDDLSANLRLKLIQAVAYFHLRDFPNGFQAFKELERESLHYGNRIIKLFLWSDSAGTPVSFTGSVARVDAKGRGELYVRDIHRNIPFLSHDTGRDEVKQGDSFTNFRIAFSMRGPLADFRE